MYSTYTSGLNGSPIFVLPLAASISAQATLDLFRLNAGDGDIGFYDDNNAICASPIPVGKKYRIVQKRGTGATAPLQFSAQYTHNPAEVDYCTVVAGVNQSVTYTITAPATFVGQRFVIKIIDRTESTLPIIYEEYEFVSQTGAETAAQIAAGIKVAYDAIQTAYNFGKGGMLSRYSLTVAGAVITITTLDKRTFFESFAGDDLIGKYTFAVVTPWNSANSDDQWNAQMQFEASNFNGYTVGTNINTFDNWGQRYNYVTKGCTYDTVRINTRQLTPDTMTKPKNEIPFYLTTRILVQTAAPNVSGSPEFTALQTLLA